MYKLLLCCLVSLVLLFTEYTSPINGSCVRVRPEDTNLFNANPVALDNMEACQQYSSGSCCTAEFASSIADRTDPLHTVANDLLRPSSRSAQCNNTFAELACLFCNTNNEQYFFPLPSGSAVDVVYICESACNKLFSDCGDAYSTVHNQSLSSAYASGKEFCMAEAWAQDVWVADVVSGDAQTCFDPSQRECTPSDYFGTYTECDPHTETREVIYTWNNDPKGCSGGVELPPPITDLPCHISCGPGLYLPLGETSCDPCREGTYSIGGGERIDYWDTWPTGDVRITTHCVHTDDVEEGNCNPWSLDAGPEEIFSGGNQGANIESILQADVHLVRDGSVTFVAKVDAESGYDGLRFQIGEPPLETHVIANSPYYNEYTFDIPEGTWTLKWIYFKDFSISSGADAAFIQRIDISGLSYADQECSSCKPGTVALQPGTTECHYCSALNHVPSPAADRCVGCPDDQYALEGDPECKDRQSCTTDDYEAFFSPCAPPSPGSRSMVYSWIQPHICKPDVVDLPPTQTGIDCLPCNPGTMRDETTMECTFCPDGQAGPGGDAPCTSCTAGTYAIKELVKDHWEGVNGELPHGWSTSCVDCDSGGFRQFDTYIDTGFASVSRWETTLAINASFYTDDGALEVVWTFKNCLVWECSLEMWNGDVKLSETYSSTINEQVTTTHQVPRGDGDILIVFTRHGMIAPILAMPRAEITRITLTGVEEGGAQTCSPCPQGYISGDGADECTACPARQEPNEDASQCIDCPVNTANDVVGHTCSACGQGTSTEGLTGQLTCTTDCVYQHGMDTFNLSALEGIEAMWGPVLDRGTGHQYYINVCSKNHDRDECHKADGTAMATYACQIRDTGQSEDMGRVLSFDYIQDHVWINYTEGSACQQREGFDRTTSIKFICDPESGKGYPSSPVDGIEDPEDLCVYHFEWYSLYGCRNCIEDDYDYFFTECENGFRHKAYYWKTAPKRCWGGVSLPPPEDPIACEALEKICPDGQRVDGKTDECVECEPGSFMVSSGELINWWSNDTLMDHDITLGCHDSNGQEEPCGGGAWTPSGYVIQTDGHAVNDAVLSISPNFIREGSVTFHYKLLSEFEEPLRFYIDGRLSFSTNTTTFGFSEVKRTIDVGTHKLEWKFSPFVTADEKVRRAELSAIKIEGSKWTGQRCEPCPPPLVASQSGSSACSLCLKDEEYDDPTQCLACPPEMYRLPGDTECRRRPACQEYDYHLEYSPCIDGSQNVSYVIDPFPICSETDPHSFDVPPMTTQACECARGYYSDVDTGECVSCAIGQSYNHETMMCAPDQEGYEAIRVVTFISPSTHEVDTSADSGWTSGCSGLCGYTNGWRIFGDSADSGIHHSQADSWLMYETELIQDGYIQFYWASPSGVMAESVLEFFIDDVPQQMAAPVRTPNDRQGRQDERVGDIHWQLQSYQVPAGSHRFVWLHHQDDAAAHGEYSSTRSLLRDVEVAGSQLGSAMARPCPAGYYSDQSTPACTRCSPGTFSNGASTKCTPCPLGEFSDEEAATKCQLCGFGTVPNKAEGGASGCITNCSWTFHLESPTPKNVTYNLSTYSNRVIDVGAGSDHPVKLSICEEMRADAPYNDCGESTFVCVDDVNTHQSFSAGTIMSAEGNSGDEDPLMGMKLIYSFGDNEGCGEDLALRRTIVHFKCNPEVNPGAWTFLEENPTCTYHVQVESLHSCPVCNDPEDYDEVIGECDGSTRTIEYSPNKACFGTKSSITESCHDVSVSLWILVIITVAVFLCIAVLVLIAGYVYISKRRVSSAYELLVSQTADTFEMSRVEEVGSPESSE